MPKASATPAMEAIAGKMLSALGASKTDQNTINSVVITTKQLSSSLQNKKVSPETLEEAIAILKKRRQEITAEGYKPKYNDQELKELAKMAMLVVSDSKFDIGKIQTQKTSL